ncbi:hydrolase [Rhizobium sp. Root73]|uniref:amidohydrolase family protein n=1 Tax=unclassified Rhizobium TaxID=2613769 RepID=UPI0007298561|nr:MULTISPECIES: amidohydrolase family protein [unclassified Rhizobium]KQY00474.1 hydrolase [Rhizobium sp. Root1334]KRC11659.1 hydrolase [Rhizobium sp. Root73]
MTACYSGPVIDPHHHLWNLSLNRHPWLEKARATGDEMVFGSLAPILRDYGVEDYRRDAANQNVVATVHVEAGWSDARPLEESRWLDGLDRSTGVASRYIARVPLDGPDAIRLIEAEAANPAVVGIRDIVSWHPEPSKSFAPCAHRMADPAWRAGLAELSRHGLVFDLMLYPAQMGEALDLVRAFPDTLFVLNHGGSPADRNETGMATWRSGVRALGREPNVRLKISDLVAYDNDWTLTSLSPIIEHCLDCFGPTRAMFASDFPVAGLHATFDEIYDVFRTLAAPLSLTEQQALFFTTANETYRLELAEPAPAKGELHV